MALQIAVEKVSVTDCGEQFSEKKLNITVNLKCWLAGADTEVDDTVIDQDFSSDYKIIEGVSLSTSITITFTDIKRQMQQCIDTYKREVALLANATLDGAVTALQSALIG